MRNTTVLLSTFDYTYLLFTSDYYRMVLGRSKQIIEYVDQNRFPFPPLIVIDRRVFNKIIIKKYDTICGFVKILDDILYYNNRHNIKISIFNYNAVILVPDHSHFDC